MMKRGGGAISERIPKVKEKTDTLHYADGKFQDSCRRKLKNYAEFFSGFSTSNSEILY